MTWVPAFAGTTVARRTIRSAKPVYFTRNKRTP